MPAHIADKICSCEYCTALDVMFGDPLLSDWEKRFVKSVAAQGWYKEYSPKQKAVIKKIFNQQQRKYARLA